jgi:D-glycero-alpha-D-manno-heptose-7-phosphate kinase
VRLSAARRVVTARAPTRLDFGGGWTDVPPYCEREGGAVCNIAITRYATATITSSDDTPSHDDPLVRAALRRAEVGDVSVSIRSDFPVSAGLGGSSAAGVALAGALASLTGRTLSRHALASLSRATEVDEMGMPGGFQDHFAAAFGGALLLTFDHDGAEVEELPLSPDFAATLSRRGVLVYTGESRISGATITAVRDAYLARESRVVDALARMRALAHEQAHAIREGDLDDLAALMGEHWIHQRALHPTITTPRIEEIMRVASRFGALGAKAMGASGGGCVLAIATDGRENELGEALGGLGERLPFQVDLTGFTLL